MSAELEPLRAAALRDYATELRGEALVLLVAPRAAPDITARNDGPVTSFLASGKWVARLRDDRSLDTERFCYRALAAALEGAEVTISVAHTVRRREHLPPVNATVGCIIPHRGTDEHLLTAVGSVARQTLRPDISVCFDQPTDAQIWRGLAGGNDLALYQITPYPAGPYVIRQHFALCADTDYLAFQDSDDVSSPDRLAKLIDHARRHDADVVGCHELRLNEIDQRVEAIRFPLDVNQALDLDTGHAQLFPTTLARSAFLKQVGGFSTARRFGSDYQFLLRVHGQGRILNCDEFLYVRRRRSGSLTTARSTSLRSPLRRWLTWRWKQSFAAVRDYGRPLDDGALRIVHARRQFTLHDLQTGASSPVLRSTSEVPKSLYVPPRLSSNGGST